MLCGNNLEHKQIFGAGAGICFGDRLRPWMAEASPQGWVRGVSQVCIPATDRAPNQRAAQLSRNNSWNQQDAARSLARLQIDMRLRRLSQRIALVDTDVDGAVLHHLEQLTRHLL